MFNKENQEIIYVKGKNVDYIQFKRLLKYKIKHLYTLKSENVDFSHYGKASEESYKILCEELNLNSDNLRIPIQKHTDIVRCVEDSNIELIGEDGLITNKKENILITRNADCILFLLYDPKKNVIANVHSGWKGTFQKIVEKAVIKMRDYYGSDTSDIICCISPSIRECHFEVEEDVKLLCEDIFAFTNKTKNFIKEKESKEGIKKYLIDTVEINKILLMDLGVKEENIIDSNMCSVCNNDKLYSYRCGDEKRNIALITL